MNQKQSLRVFDNVDFAQDAITSKATLFAQVAMAEARNHRLTTSQVVKEMESKHKGIILPK